MHWAKLTIDARRDTRVLRWCADRRDERRDFRGERRRVGILNAHAIESRRCRKREQRALPDRHQSVDEGAIQNLVELVRCKEHSFLQRPDRSTKSESTDVLLQRQTREAERVIPKAICVE